MPAELSDILIEDYFNQIKYHLPISKRSDNTSIQNWIKNALSRYAKIYVDNNKGIYDVTEVIDFYNIDTRVINVRGLNTSAETRWCEIAPISYYANKLVSCRLKEIVPDDTVLPIGVSYIQDVPITIGDSLAINNSIPSANTGKVALIGGRKLFSALTLDNTGTPFSNIIEIMAVYTYYRNVIYPIAWTGDVYVDILKKDVELTANYVVEEAYLPNKPPLPVIEAIRDREYQIIYGG